MVWMNIRNAPWPDVKKSGSVSGCLTRLQGNLPRRNECFLFHIGCCGSCVYHVIHSATWPCVHCNWPSLDCRVVLTSCWRSLGQPLVASKNAGFNLKGSEIFPQNYPTF